jgi:hypothetical protein
VRIGTAVRIGGRVWSGQVRKVFRHSNVGRLIVRVLDSVFTGCSGVSAFALQSLASRSSLPSGSASRYHEIRPCIRVMYCADDNWSLEVVYNHGMHMSDGRGIRQLGEMYIPARFSANIVGKFLSWYCGAEIEACSSMLKIAVHTKPWGTPEQAYRRSSPSLDPERLISAKRCGAMVGAQG